MGEKLRQEGGAHYMCTGCDQEVLEAESDLEAPGTHGGEIKRVPGQFPFLSRLGEAWLV